MADKVADLSADGEMKQPEEKEKKEKYVSQDGFITVPVLRGFTEIEQLYYMIERLGGKVLGGYVRYMCSPCRNPAKASDIDVYAPRQPTFDVIIKEFKDRGLEVQGENDLSVSYKPTPNGHEFFAGPQIQLIKPMEEGVVVTQGVMSLILENFDFTVVRIGLLNAGVAFADADFLHDEEKHILRIKNIHCPISTMYRVMKYNRKGYWPPSSQIISVFSNWDSRDEEYKAEIYGFFKKAADDKLDQSEIDEMEKLLRVLD